MIKKSLLDKIYYKSLLLLRMLNGVIMRSSIGVAKGYFNGKKITCIEIGVHKGSNMITMQKNLNISKIYAIDPYNSDYYYNIAHDRLKRFKNIIWIRKTSDDAIDDIKEQVDFVYIDGDHSYNVVKNDLELYIKKVKPDGIIAGHDFEFRDVATAVTEYASNNNLKINTEGTPVDWWIYIK